MKRKYKKRGQWKKCAVQGCKRGVRATIYCMKHYQRWRKWGDPLYVMKRGRKAREYQAEP